MKSREHQPVDADPWRAAYREAQDPGSCDCPSDVRLADLVTGSLSGDERLAVADHAVRCRSCTDRVRILQALHRQAGRIGLPRSGPRRPARGWWGIAAALVFAAGLVAATLVSGPRWETEVVRGGEVVAMVSPAPDARLRESPRVLRWPVVEGAPGYRVRILDARGDLVWETTTGPEPETELPADVRSGLEPGEPYLWVADPEGARALQRQGPFWFEISHGQGR